MHIEPGQTFAVRYPFCLEDFTVQDFDGAYTVQSWRPGVRRIENVREEWVADGEGQQLLTVVSTHKPGTYQERVFYTRQWADPDGKIFGKTRLMHCTMRKFCGLIHAYRYAYALTQGR